MKVRHYFMDLGLRAPDALLGNRDWLFVVGVYVALAAGIFFRQISAFPTVDLRLDNLRGTVAIASVVLAAAVAPPLKRWISRRHGGTPSFEHIAWSVTYGFFSDLLMNKIIIDVLKLAGK